MASSGCGMFKWVVICESAFDSQVTTTLADRVILSSVDWSDGVLDHLREWRGLASDAFSTWSDVKRIAKSNGVRVHGKFGQRKAAGEAAQARKALRLAENMNADAVLLHRDTDSYDRRTAYEDARLATQVPVCLAIAAPEIEAWVLHGFLPRDRAERSRISAQKHALGFDVTLKPHRPSPGRTHTRDGKPIVSSTKNVLDALDHRSFERRRQCFEDCSLEVLHDRGQETGLTAFLDDGQQLVDQINANPA